jgi:cytochrome P450
VTKLAQLPFPQTHPLELAPQLQALRSQGTIHRVRTPTGDKAWLVTDYDKVRQLLDDDRLGCAHPEPETAARIMESALFGGPLGNFDTEDTDHSRKRALMQSHFSPKHMRTLVPRVESLVSGLFDDLVQQGPPADLHTKLALPLPTLVICELLGVPHSDRDQVREWSQHIAIVNDHVRSERGLSELLDYGTKLAQHKRAHPGDDVISRLCATAGVSDGEVATLAMTLLWAAYETTVVSIDHGTLMLLTNTAQWRALLDQPALISAAVEELLRAMSPAGSVGGIVRYARTDFEIDSVWIRAGELVLLNIKAANHDPAVFKDPNCLDITRNKAAHLAFGYGARYCIGAPLARIELKTVFSQLIPRFPSMHLTVDPAELVVPNNQVIPAVLELPVSW